MPRACAWADKDHWGMDSALPQQLNNLLRSGVVTEVDHAQARCRVRSGDVHTDSIPWATAAGGLRVWAPPSVGEQVLLLSIDGDLANAIAIRGLYCQQFPAPANAEDLVLIHLPDGAIIQYDSAGHALVATLPAGGRATINADGGTTINGPVTINGDTAITGQVTVTGQVDASDDVIGGGISLKQHTHTKVQPGTGTSGPPA